MNNQEIIQSISSVLTYMEYHIDEDIDIEALVKESLMSKSAFYDVFKAIIGKSPGQFLRLRKLSNAAWKLVNTNQKVIDIAMGASYDTSEAFSRAFKKVHHMSPTAYRKNGQFTNVFPSIYFCSDYERSPHMSKDLLSTNEIVSRLLENNYQGYLFNIDIDKFLLINETYSRDGGDALLEAIPVRISEALSSFSSFKAITRIGGDQFVIVINGSNEDEIKTIADTVLNTTNSPVPYKDTEIPYSLSIGISKYSLQDHQGALQRSEDAMIEAKKAGRNGYLIR